MLQSPVPVTELPSAPSPARAVFADGGSSEILASASGFKPIKNFSVTDSFPAPCRFPGLVTRGRSRNNQVVTNGSALIDYDVEGLALHDPKNEQLRVHVFEGNVEGVGPLADAVA